MILKLMEPAISLMNKTPFKIKIFFTISTLFLLLVLPSHKILNEYLQKSTQLSRQTVGLQYIQNLHETIYHIQLHRGLCNRYFHGTKNLRQKILNSEQRIKEQLNRFVRYDKLHFKLLKQNRYFIEALSSMELILLKNIRKNISTEKLFMQHSHIIASLIKSLQESVKNTIFYSENTQKINTIVSLLSDKLLYLQEYIAQMRGLVAGVFSQKYLTKAQKNEILKRYTLINTLKVNLNGTLIPKDTAYYLEIQKQSKLAAYKLDEILDIVNHNILLNTSNKLMYDSAHFFAQATKGLAEQASLYKILLQSYQTLLVQLKQSVMINFILIALGFCAIVLSALYLFGVFYHSVSRSLEQLKTASENIINGHMDKKLEILTNDEIGDALKAFNMMQHTLRKNIAFLNSYKMAIDESSIVSKTNPKGIITYVNKKFCDISGYSENELIGQAHNIVRHPDTPQSVFQELWETIQNGQIWKGIIKNRRKNGKDYIVDATIIPLLGEEQEIIGYVGVRHDITELEQTKEEIEKQKIDFLTGLPNRNQLKEDLSTAVQPVLFYLNIDNFSDLNDFYGTKMGDQVLLYIASIFQEIAKYSGTKSYKLQGDEFALLMGKKIFSEHNYRKICQHIIDHIESSTVDCDNQRCVSITLSGGIAFSEQFDNPLNLLTYAPLARKMAKKENQKFIRYDKSMRDDKNYEKNIEWIKKIKDAIQDNRIVTFFQPIISNQNGEVEKYESLVRLIEKDGKIISPFFFLDIAKKAKLYDQITRIVIDKTFDAFAKTPYEFSINLTIEDLNKQEIVQYIYEKLQTNSFADRVIFEITESEEIIDYSIINRFIQRIRTYGAKIAIDDFGSGYANFEHILEIDADFIKIDGSLIKNIHTDEKSKIITEAIINFSKKLGRKTVVEYVHNKEVYQMVKELGADYSQGFYLGEPSTQILHKKLMTTIV